MLALLKHKVKTQNFVFQDSEVASHITVFLIQGYLHLISLEIVSGYWKLLSLQEIQATLNGYWRNQISRIHSGILETEYHEPCCGIILKT